MAVILIVEDGTGVENANAYDTFENVSAYFEEQGYEWNSTASPDPDSTQLTAIIRGTRALDAIYGDRLTGSKVGGRAQSLLFPRTGMEDNDCEEIADDVVPIEWKRAMYEMAWREYGEPGSLTPDYVQTARTVSETLGPLSVTYASSSGGWLDAQPVLTLVDKILLPLLGRVASKMFGQTTRI